MAQMKAPVYWIGEECGAEAPWNVRAPWLRTWMHTWMYPMQEAMDDVWMNSPPERERPPVCWTDVLGVASLLEA